MGDLETLFYTVGIAFFAISTVCLIGVSITLFLAYKQLQKALKSTLRAVSPVSHLAEKLIDPAGLTKSLVIGAVPFLSRYLYKKFRG